MGREILENTRSIWAKSRLEIRLWQNARLGMVMSEKIAEICLPALDGKWDLTHMLGARLPSSMDGVTIFSNLSGIDSQTSRSARLRAGFFVSQDKFDASLALQLKNIKKVGAIGLRSAAQWPTLSPRIRTTVPSPAMAT